jgi:FtsP/CotA-like multicopper oxidase with cupredoxin domain
MLGMGALADDNYRLSRRGFIGLGMATMGALGARQLVPARSPAQAATVTNPLRVPPEVSPAGLSLSAAPGVADLGGGQFSNVLAYNGLFPGPTIRASRGDSASIAFTNGLADETTIHWHGMIVPSLADGHPQQAVSPGSGYPYTFPITQRACLNWYHPHPDGLTGEQVCLGLAGAFIVNDAEEAALGLPSGAYEVPLIVRDAKLDSAGNLAYSGKMSGFVGDIPLVNGTRDARLDVDTAIYRLRVLNGANARIFRLALSNGADFTLIGNDGGLLRAAFQRGVIEIGPAERLDLVVDFRGLPLGTEVVLSDLNSGWSLVRFVVTREVSVGGSIPSGTISRIPLLSSPVRTRSFSFDGMTRINGKVYDLNRIDFQVPFGETELWRFTTKGNAPHPVHIHGAPFQVQSRTGGRAKIFPWERGWKDTVLLNDGETVEVLIRFEGYRGLYLLHCHKLEHEDAGMMSNFEVV